MTTLIKAHLVPLVESGGAKGIVAGVFSRDAETHEALGDANTDQVFEIGSIAKTFTALLLAQMADRGEVALGDPIAKYLPAGTKAPQITLLELATHTSGLPRLPPNLTLHEVDKRNPYARYTPDQLLASLADVTLDTKGKVAYSNYGFMLLGYLLERAAGKPYLQLVHERIAIPMGFSVRPGAESSRRATGHNAQGEPTPHWDQQLPGAGGIECTIADLLAYVRANIDPSSTPFAAAILDTHRVRAERVGLAWHTVERDGRTYIWHNGGTGGFHSMAAFHPDTKTGVAVIANTSTDKIDRAAINLLNALVERP